MDLLALAWCCALVRFSSADIFKNDVDERIPTKTSVQSPSKEHYVLCVEISHWCTKSLNLHVVLLIFHPNTQHLDITSQQFPDQVTIKVVLKKFLPNENAFRQRLRVHS